MTDVSNKTVLLTGALGSLGRAQAQSFVAAGADLILLDRPDHPEAQAFTRLLGERAIYVGQDLGKLHEAEEAVRGLAGKRGKTAGYQAGAARFRTRSGRGVTAMTSGTASLSPR